MRMKFPFLCKRRSLALILGAVLALSLMLGAAFMLSQVHHHCTGAHCGVCAAVSRCASFLRAETGAVLPVAAATAALWGVLPFFAFPAPTGRAARTLVSLKVKLSD